VDQLDQNALTRWRKSSRTSASGADCVEIALVGDGAAVRDTKNRAGGTLLFDSTGWESFLGAAKAGAFDRPRPI
jgi:hypothetical protein